MANPEWGARAPEEQQPPQEMKPEGGEVEKTPEQKFIESLSEYPVDHLKTLEAGVSSLLRIAELSGEARVQVLGMREVSKEELEARLQAIHAEISSRE